MHREQRILATHETELIGFKSDIEVAVKVDGPSKVGGLLMESQFRRLFFVLDRKFTVKNVRFLSF